MTGIVSSVISSKKFGFISGENGQEYFFHISDLEGDWDRMVYNWSTPDRKIQVDFEPVKTPKGPRARSVRIKE